MTTLLNTLMVLMNYANGQQVNGATYFAASEQVTARIELVIPAQNLVEEFHVTYDRGLGLVKYEYSLDPKVPPFRTSSIFKSICDHNTGLAYHMDQSTGSCSVSSLDKDTNSSFTSTHSLLKTITPDQLFSVRSMMKFVKKDIARGINTDLWTFDVDNFYVTGYGKVKTRHTLHTLSANTTKYYRGAARPAVILQRSVGLASERNSSALPLIILNYFDFFVPATPQIFDYNIMSCKGNTPRGTVEIDTKEEIQLRFTENLKTGFSESESAEVTTFRRSAWIETARAAGISPIRSIGNFWSHNDWDTYFTTVIIPETKLNFEVINKTAAKSTLEAVEDLSRAIVSLNVKVTSGNLTFFAVDLRKNVSLLASTKGEKTADVFVVYKAHATIQGGGIRATIQKLTNKQCTERCLRENSFVCQSVATCGYGDCILSAMHGDELLRPNSNQASQIANHSHCAIWSRVWTSDYIRVPVLTFPEMEPETSVGFAEKEETCAKQCSFPDGEGKECESFTWCSKSAILASSAKSACTTYRHHVFDLDGTTAPSADMKRDAAAPHNMQCHHYTKNYLVDFQVIADSALADHDDSDFEVIQADIPTETLAGWRCAKACVNKLGDDKCHSIEVCYDSWWHTGDEKTRCRVSTAFVPVGKAAVGSVDVTVPNLNCQIHSRIRYLDGSPVSQRTATNTKVSKVGKRSGNTQISVTHGYSGGEMAILAMGMIVIGGALVVAMAFGTKRFFPASEVAFARFVT